ncbi:MAG: hypothetical protein QOF30_1335 [Acidimicrobiaceae bacterium]|nr:hypothetical protein [Acidimicrobiaceae bacterium]
MVDAYYGPADLAARAAAEAPRPPAELETRARRLLADLAADTDLDATRRRFLSAQVAGLRTTAAKLAGERIGYVDEVQACYGVRPEMVAEDTFAAAHRRLDEVLPGSGPLGERYMAWRETQVVPPDKLRPAVDSLAEDLRQRTATLFGLPEGERVEFDLVTNEPWAGFNYYLGDLRSRVVINVDLPVPSAGLGHLVAHEAYPGHHTEHCRKEVGLVRRRQHLEETIFLVGTPQCLLAEGLADLGLEVVAGRRPEPVVASHLRPLGIPYDADLVAQLAEAGESLGTVRGNAALLLHDQGADVDTVVDYLARWSLLSRPRAKKAVQFLTDPTWRAYVYCYVEGVALCRRFVAGDPARFARLISEQLTPADLGAAAA